MFNYHKRFALLGDAFYTLSPPTPVRSPVLLHVNRELQSQLGLSDVEDAAWRELLSGADQSANYPSLASVYAGHQFGVPVPRLGDGRAILIAEHRDPAGRVWELQLKGAGQTPYSRMGDGRAVLRSSLREYIVSEAMHALAIPTTRAVALLNSQTPVYREQEETAAVVLRAAESFIRFGHFEYFAKRKQLVELNQLVQFVVQNYYQELDPASADVVPRLLAAVVQSTAQLIAQWQAVGFVHGVMNSDNMSILGLSLDYGPYAFMDSYRPFHPYNHSDSEGRYSYANQPQIAWWNLTRLAESLAVIYPAHQELEQVLSSYAEQYNQAHARACAAKLGLSALVANQVVPLSDGLLKIFADYQMDWTYSWRQLSKGQAGRVELTQCYQLGSDFALWYASWEQALANEQATPESVQQTMQQHNPAIVARTHLLQNAINLAAAGTYAELERLFKALATPYEEHAEFAYYYQLPPSWAEHQVLSCSS